MSAIGGPEVPRVEANSPNSAGGVIPFRRATTPRSALSVSSSGTITASSQNIQTTIEGTGYMTGIVIEVSVVTAGNSAAVAFNEDAPWNVLDSIVLSDVSGETINLSGFDLMLLNMYGGWYTHATEDDASTDANIYDTTTGTGVTGGSFNFLLRVPTAINVRNFLGLLGNQDRALKYQLRSDIAASGTIYSTAPTNAGAITLNRIYESVTVPGRSNADGLPQQIYPPKFGVQHFGTRVISDSPPVGGSQVNHFLRRLNNTLRSIVLVFRENGSRASAEANMPSRISFLIGDTTIFTESTAYRRWLMYQRFGYDAPAGVLVYDFLTDIRREAGSEFGLDYLWTAGVVNAQFQITYPAGFGSTNNSLTIITSDLIVPDSINLYAPDSV